MAEDKSVEAKKVYDTLCSVLDKEGWHYTKREEDLAIQCSAKGEDIPMDLNVVVDDDRKLVMCLSRLPFVMPEDKRLEGALAICAINNRIADGSFDYNLENGLMVFRLTTSYLESTLGEEFFVYMLICSCAIVDAYNDKLLMLAKGTVNIEKFFEIM